MPPKKETANEKAIRLQSSARALTAKSDLITVQQVLKTRPDLVQHVKRDFINMGILSADGAKITALDSKPSAHEQQGRGDIKALLDAPGSSPSHAPAAGQGDLELHRNYATWSQVPVSFLKALLSKVEPVSLSMMNLRSLTKKGCKDPPRNILLEIFEYLTDTDPNSPVGESRSLSSLADYFVRKNIQNGRRGRDLTLPVNWHAQGIYQAVAKPPVLEVRLCEQDEACIIPGLTVDEGVEVVIANNFSLARATLELKGAKPINISQAFAGQGVAVCASISPGPMAKRRRASVEGSSAASASASCSTEASASDLGGARAGHASKPDLSTPVKSSLAKGCAQTAEGPGLEASTPLSKGGAPVLPANPSPEAAQAKEDAQADEAPSGARQLADAGAAAASEGGGASPAFDEAAFVPPPPAEA